jgi:hypothetical protein
MDDFCRLSDPQYPNCGCCDVWQSVYTDDQQVLLWVGLIHSLIILLIRFMLVVYLQLAWFVTMVTVAASAPVHNDSKFVFRT